MLEHIVYIIQIKENSKIIESFIDTKGTPLSVIEVIKKLRDDKFIQDRHYSDTNSSSCINKHRRIYLKREQLDFQFDNSTFFHPDKTNNIHTLLSKKVVIKA